MPASVACALIATATVTLRPAPSYPIYDGSGERLESLSAGIAPDAEAKVSLLHDGASARGFDGSLPAGTGLRTWSCKTRIPVSPLPAKLRYDGGHYFYYSDPQHSPWRVGWQDAGELACGTCGPCAERSCTNWY